MGREHPALADDRGIATGGIKAVAQSQRFRNRKLMAKITT
jgi:hypothetical protein